MLPEVNEVPEVPEVPEEKDDFAAGYADDADDVPTETPEPEEAPAAEPEPPKLRALTEDEYNSLKASIDSVTGLKSSLDKQFGTAFGKIGGIERVIQQIQTQTPAGEVPQITDDDLEELKSDYPDLTSGIAKGLNRVLSKMRGTGSAEQAPPVDVDRLRQEISTQLEQKMETKSVARAHADFKEVFASDDFHEWRAKLPDDARQELADTWDSDLINRRLTEYKESKKPKEPATPQRNTRKELLAAAVAPRGSSGHTRAKEEVDDFADGYNNG